MSTVLECIAARWVGLEVCGVSLVTNAGAGYTRRAADPRGGPGRRRRGGPAPGPGHPAVRRRPAGGLRRVGLDASPGTTGQWPVIASSPPARQRAGDETVTNRAGTGAAGRTRRPGERGRAREHRADERAIPISRRRAIQDINPPRDRARHGRRSRSRRTTGRARSSRGRRRQARTECGDRGPDAPARRSPLGLAAAHRATRTIADPGRRGQADPERDQAQLVAEDEDDTGRRGEERRTKPRRQVAAAASAVAGPGGAVGVRVGPRLRGRPRRPGRQTFAFGRPR